MISQGLLQYKTAHFDVPFPRKASDIQMYSVQYKDALPSIFDIIEDDLINERICLYPEHRGQTVVSCEYGKRTGLVMIGGICRFVTT